MLEVTHLDFDYSDKPLLQAVNFSLDKGNLLHIQGKNGSGKTTLLKLLSGLLCPTQGEIRYQGALIYKSNEYKQSMCFLGHKVGVSALLTPREHWIYDLSPTMPKLTFDEVMMQLSLQGSEDTPCGLLSAGQRRRVGLMRLFITKASLWLLDEPLIALDAQTVLTLKTMLEKHLALGGQVILTSHQTLPFPRDTYQVYAL
jgi:heme exporter protein A